MIDIRAVIQKEKLYCTIRGNITKSELLRCIEKLKYEADKLSDGFIFMKDISNLKTEDQTVINLLNHTINKQIYPRALVVITITTNLGNNQERTCSERMYYRDSNKYTLQDLKEYINTISFDDQLN